MERSACGARAEEFSETFLIRASCEVRWAFSRIPGEDPGEVHSRTPDAPVGSQGPVGARAEGGACRTSAQENAALL